MRISVIAVVIAMAISAYNAMAGVCEHRRIAAAASINAARHAGRLKLHFSGAVFGISAKLASSNAAAIAPASAIAEPSLASAGCIFMLACRVP